MIMLIFEKIKKFLKSNWKFLLATYLVYFTIILLIIPVNNLAETTLLSLGLSSIPTLLTSLTYLMLSHFDKNGSSYKILSFIVIMTAFVLFMAYLIFFGFTDGPPEGYDERTCREAVRVQCQVAGEANISISSNCINGDGSILRDAIPYDLKEAQDVNNTKVVCPNG